MFSNLEEMKISGVKKKLCDVDGLLRSKQRRILLEAILYMCKQSVELIQQRDLVIYLRKVLWLSSIQFIVAMDLWWIYLWRVWWWIIPKFANSKFLAWFKCCKFDSNEAKKDNEIFSEHIVKWKWCDIHFIPHWSYHVKVPCFIHRKSKYEDILVSQWTDLH